MAYLEGLLHRPGKDGTEISETRSGIPYFNGSAWGFKTWRFKIRGRLTAVEKAKEEDREAKHAELAAQIVEGLSDEALNIAMDIGSDVIGEEGGINTLINTIEKHVIQYKQEEAQALFTEGSSKDGPLSRQPGEPMTKYIQRRKRWATRLFEMDSGTIVSPNILAGYLIEYAKLTETQVLMV